MCSGHGVFPTWSYGSGIKRPQSFCQKCRWQLHLNMQVYTFYLVNSCCLGTAWEPARKTGLDATHRDVVDCSHFSSLSPGGLTLTYRVELVCASLFPLKRRKNTDEVWFIKLFPPNPHRVICKEEATTTTQTANCWRGLWVKALDAMKI